LRSEAGHVYMRQNDEGQNEVRRGHGECTDPMRLLEAVLTRNVPDSLRCAAYAKEGEPRVLDLPS